MTSISASYRVDAKQVDVQLPMLAHAAALRLFVAEKIRNRIPAQGEDKLASPGRDHASDRRRHLRPQRDLALAAIGESVCLLVDDLFAGFGRYMSAGSSTEAPYSS